ncbi:MAG: hypothetical protein PUH11_07470 [Bacilli bacterium]|nr:hypothetical protein [Bacilli bacterium]MDD7315546.1 hypothetical protein [Bacilli bacterium]MDY4052521.1 hypothetical protein [Bacilli bacterium]
MNKLFLFLENMPNQEFDPPKSFYVGVIIIIAILCIPWIALLIYALTLKYRVRLFSDNILIGTYKFKKGEKFLEKMELPTRKGCKIEGLYRDEEFMLPLEFEEMPNRNIKLYIKWVREQDI